MIATIHLLTPEFSDNQEFYNNTKIYAVCGAEVELHLGSYGETFVLGLPIAQFLDCEHLHPIEPSITECKPCEKCMAHPDYPLMALGVY